MIKEVRVHTTANKKGELSEAKRTNTGEKPIAERPIPIIRKTLTWGSHVWDCCYAFILTVLR